MARTVSIPPIESFGRLTQDKWLALKTLEEAAETVEAVKAWLRAPEATALKDTRRIERRLRKATHRPEPANDPTICAICGAPLTDTTSSICPDCRELEKDW